jgi:hypothetical protein
MKVNLPEIEILLLQQHLQKRRVLLFIKENLFKSNLTEKMIGHKLGEYSNKKVGARIIILHGI